MLVISLGQLMREDRENAAPEGPARPRTEHEQLVARLQEEVQGRDNHIKAQDALIGRLKEQVRDHPIGRHQYQRRIEYLEAHAAALLAHRDADRARWKRHWLSSLKLALMLPTTFAEEEAAAYAELHVAEALRMVEEERTALTFETRKPPSPDIHAGGGGQALDSVAVGRSSPGGV